LVLRHGEAATFLDRLDAEPAVAIVALPSGQGWLISGQAFNRCLGMRIV
jgi:hypothetical protein